MSTLLAYAVTTDPFPLQASPDSGEPVTCTLTIIATNPAPDPYKNPVTVQGIRITLPLGPAGDDLTDAGVTITPPDVDEWTLQPNTDAGVFDFVPTAGPVQVGADPLTFVFTELEVNRKPGTVEGLKIMEGTPGNPECCLSGAITKFPAGWTPVQFSYAPAVIEAGSTTTLKWSGGAYKATYTIEYAADGRVNTVPAEGDPPLESPGTWTSPDLTESTVFTFSVSDTIDGVQYGDTQPAPVTVVTPAPSITQFSGTVAYDSAGACQLTLHWQTDADHCTLSVVAEELDASSPADGFQFAVTDPTLDTITLTAYSRDDQQSTAQLELEWVAHPTIVELPGDTLTVAVSSDGSKLYVASGAALTAYRLPADPVTPPDALYAIETGKNHDISFEALAVTPGSQPPELWTLYPVSPDAPAGWKFQVITDTGAKLQTDGSAFEVDQLLPDTFKLAVAPGGNSVYLMGCDSNALQALTQTGKTPSSVTVALEETIPSAAGEICVGADGTIFVPIGQTVAACQMSEQGFKELTTNAFSEDGVTGCALGGVLVAYTSSAAFMLDQASLSPLRSSIGLSATTLAVSPDGMRLYAGDIGAQTVSIVAPGQLTGGV